MKTDFNTEILDFNGKPIPYRDGSEIVNTTAKRICIAGLTAALKGEESLPGDKKFQRYQIAQKINDDKEISIEEAKIIKEVVGKGFDPLIVGRIYELLEGGQ